MNYAHHWPRAPSDCSDTGLGYRARVIGVCKDVVKKLRDTAVDDAHVPYSYAVFLEGALEKAVPESPIPAPAR